MNPIASSISNFRSLEALALGDSALHLFHARLKVLFTLFFCVTVISIPAYDLLLTLPFFGYLIFGCSAAGIPGGLLLKRIVPALPLVCFAGISNLLFDSTSVFWGDLSLPGGAVSFAVLIVKSILTVGAVLILAAVTPLNRIAGALLALHVPCIVVLELTLTWRYLSVIAEEAGKMFSAYQLRNPERRSVAFRDWPKLVGSLLLRSLARSERIYGAMRCRLFDARIPQGRTEPESAGDWGVFLIACAGCLVLRFYPVLYGLIRK